jgi:hypothetical protein
VSEDEYVDFEVARAQLRAPRSVFQALVLSGLLGPFEKGKVSKSGVQQFYRYGTQWRSERENRELGKDPYQGIDIAESTGGEHPPETRTQIQISSVDPAILSPDKDVGWIAQFYLRVNRHFFPDPTAMALIGPVTLKLKGVREVKGTALPAYLYPDPNGALAMIMVIGNPQPLDDAFKAAYDVASPILDELSLRYDQPLPIAQAIAIGIPSGAINVWLPKVPKLATISDDSILPKCPHAELTDAVALYREAVSSSNPFHKYLTLWKTYENVCAARGIWRTRTKQRDLKPSPETIPELWAFGDFRGLSFDKAKQRLNDSYRVSLAHGAVKGGKPRTAASSADFTDVSVNIPIIRYMARTALLNFRHTLDQVSLSKPSNTR